MHCLWVIVFFNSVTSCSDICSWSGQTLSGMAVIEVGLPSGYVAGYENQIVDLIKLVETQKDKLVLYIDEVK
jgi:hypothetical protein